MTKLLRARQLLADLVPPADLCMLFCGGAVALFLAWLL
jgi:hypothetical protein